ncbi:MULTISPECIES: phospholipase D-like domain-containing protein [unclassified Haloferax]|uniref:phospholipase D-like domain-containing protein n=1 Tax=unclassified Haloferax TaxID=2625095 RepID=UPI0028765FB4|nr:MULTISPECIES: phospholipase D-like domain-containing protein [unclassified Haloferax]MDS0243567.1 phospholipase D family protein [Haloferax sp. S2CR25]MDS0446688.1 phospholipase D family protein [Haloferax sp. S2CR25-2]
MTNSLPAEVADIRTRSPESLWGVSAESIYLAVCAVATDTNLTYALRPHHIATVFQTNDERAPETIADVHLFLLTKLGLVTDTHELTDCGRFVLASERPADAVRLVATRRLPRIQQLLREFATIDTDRLPRSELDTLVRDAEDEVFIAPLLSSLAFISLYPEGVILNRETITQTVDRLERHTKRPNTAITLITALTALDNSRLIARVATTYTNTTITPADVDQTAPLDALATIELDSPERTPVAELTNAIEDTRLAVAHHAEIFETALDPEDHSVECDDATVDSDLVKDVFPDDPSREAVTETLDLIATIHTHPTLHSIALSSLTDTLDLDPYPLYRTISNLPGVDCSLRDDLLITFDAVPSAPEGTDRYDGFRDDLFDALHTRLSWFDALTDVTLREAPRMRENIIESLVMGVDDDLVAPTYFVYTLPDPEALGKERMEQYVDDQPALRRERARLKRWKDQRDNDLRRFTEMTDRLFTRGQERDLDERVVRIMTPYDDDTFSEYTSQLRSLLRDGYELRLLTRHTKRRWEWERLRDNLLGDLEENRENVTIRTYSRYKKYQRITSETDETDLAEFGIHAKLQTIGHATEGAALLGSANFMENSYNWNPECGVYTENSNFVAAAIDFFDHVWELSEADEVDLSSLQEIPRRSFYPSYYT